MPSLQMSVLPHHVRHDRHRAGDVLHRDYWRRLDRRYAPLSVPEPRQGYLRFGQGRSIAGQRKMVKDSNWKITGSRLSDGEAAKEGAYVPAIQSTSLMPTQ
jgi:hypothetical protein